MGLWDPKRDPKLRGAREIGVAQNSTHRASDSRSGQAHLGAIHVYSASWVGVRSHHPPEQGTARPPLVVRPPPPRRRTRRDFLRVGRSVASGL